MRLPLRTIYNRGFSKKHLPSINPIIKPTSPPSPSPQMTVFSSSTVGTTANRRHRWRDKVVVIMGPTGCGKSRLSIDLGIRFPSEIINSDKIQVYKGLDVTTNKIPHGQRLGVPHHLLGEVDSADGEFTPSQYRARASSLISQIISRRRLPLIVGGSNSFIYALLVDRFDQDSDVFSGSDTVCSELSYRCCFLWVDVSLPVLNEYLVKRVDDMLDSGMMDELAEYYESEVHESEVNTGLRKAIGVPELKRYFRGAGDTCQGEEDWVRRGVYGEAVRTIKDNTCQLARRQIEKIERLKEGGWGLQRVDATESFRAVIEGSKGCSDIWEREVVEPSMKIVKRFLEE